MEKNNLKPRNIHVGITDRCNLKCLHCDIWKSGKRNELTCKQWMDILKRIKKWLGPFRLDVSGGEPFLRSDMLDIIDFCNKNEILIVITTNATMLNPGAINKLSRIKNLTLNISIDSVNPDAHDYLKNTKGAHQQVMDALLEFKKNNRICNITMATILMGYNIEEIMLLIKKLMIDKIADAISFQALDNNFSAKYDPGWFKQNKLWPSKDKMDIFLNILDGIIRIKNAGGYINNSAEQLESIKYYFENPTRSINGKCNTGDINFIMNPSGDVLLCWNMAPIGNAVSGDLEKIWHSTLAEKRREDIAQCTRTCRILNCNTK